eukprot:283133-Rhodomonas_salina.2
MHTKVLIPLLCSSERSPTVQPSLNGSRACSGHHVIKVRSGSGPQGRSLCIGMYRVPDYLLQQYQVSASQ